MYYRCCYQNTVILNGKFYFMSLVCGKCSDRFVTKGDNVPRILHCLHSLCVACARKSVKSCKIKCTICNYVTEIVEDIDELQENFLILKEIETNEILREDPICGNCEKKKSCSKCLNCDDDCSFLCENCAMDHSKIKLFRKHKLVSLVTYLEVKKSKAEPNNITQTCNVHPDEILLLYCDDCDIPICRDCITHDHRPHKYIFAAEAFAKFSKELADNVQETQNRRKEIMDAQIVLRDIMRQLDEQRESINQSITKTFAELQSDVSEREKHVNEQLNDLYHTKHQLLESQLKSITNLANLLEYTCNYSHEILENSNSTPILRTKLLIMKRLIEVRGLPCSLNPISEADLEFKRADSITAIVDGIANLAKISSAFSDALEFNPNPPPPPTYNFMNSVTVLPPIGIDRDRDSQTSSRAPSSRCSSPTVNTNKLTIAPNCVLTYQFCEEGCYAFTVTLPNTEDSHRLSCIVTSYEQTATTSTTTPDDKEVNNDDVESSFPDNNEKEIQIFFSEVPNFMETVYEWNVVPVDMFACLLVEIQVDGEDVPGSPLAIPGLELDGEPGLLFGADRGSISDVSGEVKRPPSKDDSDDSETESVGGDERLEWAAIQLHSDFSVVDRLEIKITSMSSLYKLSYRKQGFHEDDDWIPFQVTPDWEPTPGLGVRWTVKLDEEERRLAAPCAEIRLDVCTNAENGLYSVNVYGWMVAVPASKLPLIAASPV